MTRAAIFLRISLILVLVCNGASSAWAGAMMLGDLAAPAKAEATAALGSTHTGCHEQATASDEATAPKTPAPSGHSDCCGPGLCACACTQLPGVADVVLLVVPAVSAHAPWIAEHAIPPRSAVLRHLIRPPIFQA